MPKPQPTKRVSLQASSSSTDRVLVGRVGRPHGLHGYVVVHPDTDNPDRFAPGSRLTSAADRLFTVERSQRQGGSLLVRFVDIDDRTAAEAITGTELFIDASQRRSLDDDEFWPDELVGLAVFDHAGDQVGSVVGVMEGAAQFRLDIQGPGVRFEVPFVAALVPEVDIDRGVIVLADLPGLIPES